MVPGRPRLGALLVDQGLLTADQLLEATEHQLRRACRLGESIVELGLCSDIEVARALAEQLEVPFVNLRETPPLPSLVVRLPQEVAAEHGALPVRIENGRVLVAARDPCDLAAEAAVQNALGLPVLLACAPQSQLRDLLSRYCGLAPAEAARAGAPPEALSAALASRETGSAVELVERLLADALHRGASDLHLQAEEEIVTIRFRTDGRLRTSGTYPAAQHQPAVARIKILAGMDIADTRRPQDGGARLQVGGETVEIRVSILPGIHGESVVVRLFNHDPALQRLEALGFAPDTLDSMRGLLAERHGMILATGPAGAGKTTTLYAGLVHLNDDRVKIITVEDPVEVKLPGVTQVQVQDRANCSFASFLRAMLRHDPDIITVGEIRDLETAEIACRAALTGHLVLSSLHTRDSIGALTRLCDMGIPRYVVAACLNAVLAQRLVRRICPRCSVPYTVSPGLAAALVEAFGARAANGFRRGQGCQACHYTGTQGRVGVYELLRLTEEMRHPLLEGASAAGLKAEAIRQGLRTLAEDAFEKALAGTVPPEEVLALLPRRSVPGEVTGAG